MTDIQVFYTGPIVKRADSVENGLDKYFTGNPCANGHVDQRTVIGSNCLSCTRERRCRWNNANADKKKMLDAEWQRNNKEKVAERNRKWQVKNKGKFRAYTAKRRTKERENGGYHDEADIVDHLLMQGWLCASCKCDLKMSGYEVDHIIPVSKGGSSWPDNIQCLCRSCNRSKGNKMPEDWH